MDSRALREALRKQGIYVHESDPILDMAAICAAAMAETLRSIEGVVKAATERISAATEQTVDASREAGEAIVNQGASFLVAEVRDAVREATEAVLAELREETARAVRARRVAVATAWIAGGVIGVAVALLVGFWVAGLVHADQFANRTR